MESKFRRIAYQLADKHLRELPDEVIVKESPSHYGLELCDEHKLFMWNGLVDHYLDMDEAEIYDAYTRHIKQNEPIIKAIVSQDLEPELQLLVDSIIHAFWDRQEKHTCSIQGTGSTGNTVNINGTDIADIPTVGVGNGSKEDK